MGEMLGAKKLIVFKTDPDLGDRFFRFVHIRRQIYLKMVLDVLPKSVEQLWVFGSALTYWHTPWSDLDLIVLGHYIQECDKKTIKAACIKASETDTWNECKNVDVIYDTPENFEEWCTEFGHCYYDAVMNGVKYFDRSWQYE